MNRKRLVECIVCFSFLQSISAGTTPTCLYIGNETIDLEEAVGIPICSTPGVEIAKSGSRWKVVLGGAHISGAGIQADGDLTIELLPGKDNDIEIVSEEDNIGLIGWGACAYGINTTHDLTISGSGHLTINNFVKGGSDEVAGIMVGRDGWFSGNLSITGGCSLQVTCVSGKAINVDNAGTIEIADSSVTLTSPSCGFCVNDGFCASKSVLNVMAGETALLSDGGVKLDHVYGTFVSKGECGIAADSKSEVRIENSIVNSFTGGWPCISAGTCRFGMSACQLAISDQQPLAAIWAQNGIVVDGAMIDCCTPAGTGIYVYDNSLTMKAGRVRVLSSINVQEAFLYNEITADFCGLMVSWQDSFNPRDVVNNVISHAFVDFIRAALLSNPSGEAEYVAQGGSYNSFLKMEGGTILADNSLNGVAFTSIEVSGGSLKGPVSPTPTYGGKDLKCVDEAVSGGWSYAHVSDGWTTSLPTYYGTDSLYLDGESKLYFWVPVNATGGDIPGGADEDPIPPEVQENLKLDYFYSAIMNGKGYCSQRNVFSVDEDIYYVLQILAYRDRQLTFAPANVKYTVKLGNGFEETRVFKERSGNLDGHYASMPIGRLPLGRYTMTCSIDPNGSLEDSDPSDNVRSATFEVVSNLGWNFVFDEAPVVMGAAGQPVKATVVFHNETGHATIDPVECLFSVRANGREIGSFVKSYAIGADGKVRDTVDLAEHMSLPMGDYELTCRLDSSSAYAETNENDNEQTVSFRVAYPNISVYGFFDSSVARSYRGVLFRDGITVLGLVELQTSGWDIVNRTVKVTGTVTDAAGKSHKIKGTTKIGEFNIPRTLKCKVDVDGYGSFDLTFGYYGSGSNQKAAFTGNNGAGLSMYSLVDGIEVKPPQAPTPSSGGSALPFASAATVYDGSLLQGGRLVGTIQVKVAKGKVDKKTGAFSAKVTATVQLADGSRKISFKNGVADAAGNVTGLTAAGHTLDVSLGVNGMGGTMDGMSVDGARNVFSAKDADSKATAAAIEKQWVGAVNVVGDGVVLSVTVAKKGKVKVSGAVDGVKVSATSQLLVGETDCCIPVVITKKAKVAFNLWLGADGSVEVAGLAGATAGKAGTLKSGAAFRMDGAALARVLPGLLTDYLPGGLSVAQSGAKWVVAGGAKVGSLKLLRGTSEIDREKSKFTDNMSGLKLTYKAKDGSFKGSFKAYALENGKIKSYTVNVTGVMVGDKGYGTATLKKPAVSFPVTIE